VQFHHDLGSLPDSLPVRAIAILRIQIIHLIRHLTFGRFYRLRSRRLPRARQGATSLTALVCQLPDRRCQEVVRLTVPY
jgi:hypothetical protein